MLKQKASSNRHSTILMVAVLWCITCSIATGASFEFFAVNDLVRIFEDGFRCPEPEGAIEIFGIRNEYVSAQCVVKANANIEHVTVSVSPLINGERSFSLDQGAVRWNFVGSIPILENTPKPRKTDLTRQAPARFPDYLAEDRQISLGPNEYRAVFLTIKIPRDAAAGQYEGTVTIETEQASKSLPLRLCVYPVTLPDERHLMVTKWCTTSKFKQFHGITSADSEKFYQMLALYARNMAEHRQNVFRVSLGLIASSRDGSGEFKFDFSKFDKWADVFWNTGRMDLLETGFVARFGDGGWSSTEILLRDFRVLDESTGRTVTVAGKDFLTHLLPALENHLREKGWLDKTVFHIADEPSNHNVMSWREASDFVHHCAPGLKRMDAIETPHCFDRLEIWVPKLDHLATWYDVYKRAQEKGNELWFYTVGIFQGGSYPNKTADVALIESRILHWLNYRFGLKGYLHWGFNQWTDDPFEAPGKHRGDGWQVYPKKDGLMCSLRWEQMRNGLQDYEYLWMLEDKTAKIRAGLGERLSIIDPARRGVEIASQIVRSMSKFSRDPNDLYAAKKQIIDELMDLDRPPRVIVQTNPREYTAVAGGCAIDLYGWAEPGTRITIGGREIPVSDDGLFMENARLSRDYKIVVEARKDRDTKKIVRFFELLN